MNTFSLTRVLLPAAMIRQSDCSMYQTVVKQRRSGGHRAFIHCKTNYGRVSTKSELEMESRKALDETILYRRSKYTCTVTRITGHIKRIIFLLINMIYNASYAAVSLLSIASKVDMHARVHWSVRQGLPAILAVDEPGSARSKTIMNQLEEHRSIKWKRCDFYPLSTRHLQIHCRECRAHVTL
jgi:hypothetical protein